MRDHIIKSILINFLALKLNEFLMHIRLPAFLLSLLLFTVLTSFEYRSVSNEPREKIKKAFRIMVISDLNSSYGSVNYSDDVKAVIAQLSVIRPDMILCGGDMVAGQKASLSEENIDAMWAGFKTSVLDPIQRLKIPFGFTMGNHDASPAYLTDRRISKTFWLDNADATGLSFVDSTHYPFYYSYIKNKVFFMSWDAAGAQINPEVFNWMSRQLSGKAALKARLRILTGHLPLYAIVDSKNKPGEVNSDPETALAFFKAHGLDLYISGHQHAYYPAEKQGIRFLNAGCIGDGARKLIGDETDPKKTYTIIEIPRRRAGKFSYKTYMPQSNTEIDLKSLPDSIFGFNGISRLEGN